ncbi:MAG: hypothetical protein ACJAT2_000921 [Bacteriovoracaceae bacterium]|jgi:hypothetical protein
MEEVDSVYLYSKDQKPLYDNVLKELESKSCPHTHTVYALMDVEEADIPKNMADHVSRCKECQKTVLLNQAIMGRINQLLPEFQTLTPPHLAKNCQSLLKRSEFSSRTKAKKMGVGVLKESKASLMDALSVLLSVKMGLTYLAAVMITLFLNWIL